MTQTRTPGRDVRTPQPARPQPGGPITLTGRGAVLALFASCFLGLLIAAWTGWGVLADVTFVMTCGGVACYTRVSGLRWVVISPPLAFLTGSVLAQVLTAADSFSAAEGILVTLGSSALWLFTGTLLTVVVALGRGYRPGLPRLPRLGNLREALRDARPGRRDGWVRRRLGGRNETAG
jgi:hypothetical protein